MHIGDDIEAVKFALADEDPQLLAAMRQRVQRIVVALEREQLYNNQLREAVAVMQKERVK
jgi:hypothetical protein